MAQSKYGRYIIREPIGRSAHPEITCPTISMKNKKVSGGKEISLELSCITRPFLWQKDSQTHEFDRYLFFVARDPYHPEEFKADIELVLGKEGEIYHITEPRAIYIPKGLAHFPLNILKVDSPIMLLDIALTPGHPAKIDPAPAGKSKYSQFITAPNLTTHEMVTTTHIDGKLIREQKRNFPDWNYVSRDAGGGDLTMYWYVISNPQTMYEPPHAHDHDQFAVHVGVDPQNFRDFDAELFIWLGEEAEKQVIDSTAIVHLAPGLVHRYVDYRRVDKPFMLLNIFMNSEYRKARTLKDNG